MRYNKQRNRIAFSGGGVCCFYYAEIIGFMMYAGSRQDFIRHTGALYDAVRIISDHIKVIFGFIFFCFYFLFCTFLHIIRKTDYMRYPMFKEFKNFALKGNVIDLAVGVIIAGAFGKIVSSLVGDIFMPVIGLLLGGVNFSDLKYVISPATETKPEAAIYYGAFIQSVVDFLIIAVSLFILVKMLSVAKKNEALAHLAPSTTPAPPPSQSPGASASASPGAPAPSPNPQQTLQGNQEKLLAEIRDLLKNRP